jgi:hypothetical protein
VKIDEQQRVKVSVGRSGESKWLAFDADTSQIPTIALVLLNAFERGRAKLNTRGDFEGVVVEVNGQQSVFRPARERYGFIAETRQVEYVITFLTEGYVCGFAVDHVDVSCDDPLRTVTFNVNVDLTPMPESEFRARLDSGDFAATPVPVLRIDPMELEFVQVGSNSLIEIVLSRKQLKLLTMMTGYALLNEQGGAILGDLLEATLGPVGASGKTISRDNLERIFNWGLLATSGKGPPYMALIEENCDVSITVDARADLPQTGAVETD